MAQFNSNRVNAVAEARRLRELSRLYIPSIDGYKYAARAGLVEDTIAKLEKLEAEYKEAKR